MNQTISKKRKIMCISGGVSYLLLNILGVIAMLSEFGSEELMDQAIMDFGILLSSLALSVVLICDIISVFSESFRIKLETTERKYKLVPIVEAIILIMSISSLILGILGLCLIFIFIGMLGGDVIAILISMLLFAIIVIANLIMVLLSKLELLKNKPAAAYPQMNYPMQNNNGFTYPAPYGGQAENFPQPTNGYFPQGMNNPQPTNGYFPQGMNNHQPTNGYFPQEMNNHQPTNGYFPQGMNNHQSGNQ